MSEGELIEIEQRFRHLANCVETADSFLATQEERKRNRIAALDADLHNPAMYEAARREMHRIEKDADRIAEVRYDLSIALERILEDADSLKAEIRRGAK